MDRTLPAEAERPLAELLEIIELSTPLRWETARLSVQSTVLTSTWTTTVTNKDGTTKSIPLQRAFEPKLTELRGACYEQGRGTWYSANITLHRDGEPDVHLHYDEKPEGRRGAWPHPYSYVRDLEFFPRDEEHMPDWLREQVELAAEAETNGWQVAR
jgi:hypothetical protein